MGRKRRRKRKRNKRKEQGKKEKEQHKERGLKKGKRYTDDYKMKRGRYGKRKRNMTRVGQRKGRRKHREGTQPHFLSREQYQSHLSWTHMNKASRVWCLKRKEGSGKQESEQGEEGGKNQGQWSETRV